MHRSRFLSFVLSLSNQDRAFDPIHNCAKHCVVTQRFRGRKTSIVAERPLTDEEVAQEAARLADKMMEDIFGDI